MFTTNMSFERETAEMNFELFSMKNALGVKSIILYRFIFRSASNHWAIKVVTFLHLKKPQARLWRFRYLMKWIELSRNMLLQ